MRTKYRILGGVAGATVLSTIGLGMAGGAQASTTSGTPAPTTGIFPATEFQCGPNNWVGALVPENPPGGANFHYACVAHDTCYDYGSPTDRADCDGQFLSRMYFACDQAGGGSWCYGTARTYYYAVRGAGWAFYKGSGANN